MSDENAALRTIETAFRCKTPTVLNGTGLTVQLMQSAPPCGAESGSGRADNQPALWLDVAPRTEVVLEADEPLGALQAETPVPLQLHAAPGRSTWCRVRFLQLRNDQPVIVRPEVGAALAAGAVHDTRVLDGVVVLVPLNYTVEKRGLPAKAVLVVRSLYVWTRDERADEQRKRTRTQK